MSDISEPALLARRGADLVVAIDDRCTACGACLATCPEGALRRAPRRPLVLADRCTGCLACLEICPAGAVSVLVVPPGAPTPGSSPGRGPCPAGAVSMLVVPPGATPGSSPGRGL